MLAIRLQRRGRRGHAQYRFVVQDSRRTTTSGKVVAYLGHYNPHTKVAVVTKDRAGFYLEHGAQPSPRVASLFRSEGITLPGWVKLPADKTRGIKNAEKLRRNRVSADADTVKPSTGASEAEQPAARPENEAEPETTTDQNTDSSSADAADTPASEAVSEMPPADKTADASPKSDSKTIN